jgi:hypothetical protein
LKSAKGTHVDLGLDVKEHNGWAVLSVQGEVDVYTAPQFREQLIQLVDQGQRAILVDLEASSSSTRPGSASSSAGSSGSAATTATWRWCAPSAGS